MADILNNNKNISGTANKGKSDSVKKAQRGLISKIQGTITSLGELNPYLGTSLEDIDNSLKKTASGLHDATGYLKEASGYLKSGYVPIPSSPIDFLIYLMQKVLPGEKFSNTNLVKWLSNIIVLSLPEIETAIKATLLSNIKSTVSCSADPRIPIKYRKLNGNSYLSKNITDIIPIIPDINEYRGFIVNIDSIDPTNILAYSPFSPEGSRFYFTENNKYTATTEMGVYDNTNEKWRLSRADDFNAFLWFVINCSHFNKGNVFTVDQVNPDRVKIGNTEYLIKEGSKFPLGAYKLSTLNNSDSDIANGMIIENSGHYSICTSTNDLRISDVKPYRYKSGDDIATKNSFYSKIIETNGKTTGNTIVPISDDLISCNWYANKTDYYSANISETGERVRSKKKDDLDYYNNSKPLCNLSYVKPGDPDYESLPTSGRYIRLTILPKPLFNVDIMSSIRFNGNGEMDPNGIYSLPTEKVTSDGRPYVRKNSDIGEYVVYNVGEDSDNCFLIINKETKRYSLGKLIVDGQNVKMENIYETKFSKHLIECYCGNTIYEFNYDFVMGMRLFDAKTVVSRLIYSVLPSTNVNFGLSFNKQTDPNTYMNPWANGRILEVIRKIIDSDNPEISDCFFKFSNDEYARMIQEGEKERSTYGDYLKDASDKIDASSIFDILSSYNESATKVEQIDTITRAFEQASAVLGYDENVTSLSDSGKFGWSFSNGFGSNNIFKNMLEQLLPVLTESLFSPKVLLLFAINNELMGSDSVDIEDIFDNFRNVVTNVTTMLTEMIISEFVKYITKELTDLINKRALHILNEQYSVYMIILRDLLRLFNEAKGTYYAGKQLESILKQLIGNKNANYDLPTMLDNVDYAEIFSETNNSNDGLLDNC